jgi:hypothetical protein
MKLDKIKVLYHEILLDFIKLHLIFNLLFDSVKVKIIMLNIAKMACKIHQMLTEFF